MSIVGDYGSSSSDESDNGNNFSVPNSGDLNNLNASSSPAAHRDSDQNQLHGSVPRQKKRIFGASMENVYYDPAVFRPDISTETKNQAKRLKKARKGKSPWASYEEDDEEKEEAIESAKTSDGPEEDDSDTEDSDVEKTSQFFGSSLHDYLGRSYIHIPRDIPINLNKSPGSQRCSAPQTLIHTFVGHTKGVTKLELFPRSGHLLLSSGNDGVIRLWQTYHERSLLREFYGHKQAVKDVNFNSDGTKFLSCGYDKMVRLWDTETGEILKSVKVKATPNVIKFNPVHENEFIVGLSNHDIEHYDLARLDYDTPIQVYNHHLGAINSLTIIDNQTKFMSTSDDKSVRFWQWQVNIPIKLISDPTQHSMPCAAVSPDGAFIALQTMDNTVQVVQGHGKFRFNRNKVFRGHNVAGYGIGLDFSADGRYLASGDSKGSVFFWDWKTTRLAKRIKVSDKAVSCVEFLPQEVSKTVMAGLSGEIYMYE